MAITQNSLTGAPLYLKDSAYASKFFGGVGMLNQPKRKFTFAVGFIGNPTAMDPETVRMLSDPNYVFLVKSFDPPKLNFDTEVVNQYNKKRVIQKKVNYTPITITFHDDVDNKMYELMANYFRYYFADSFNVSETDWDIDTVDVIKKPDQWGYTTKTEKNIFTAMWVAWTNSGRLTLMYIMNPLFTELSFDRLDYGDNTPLEISAAIEYEGIIFKEINLPLSQATTDVASIVRNLFAQGENIGQPFAGPDPIGQAQTGSRSFGLGEIFNAATTFYGKYNGSPTIQDALNDFVLRPLKGSLSGGLGSWGNFNFGGIGTSKSSTGLLGGVASILSPGLQYLDSAKIIPDINSVIESTGSAVISEEGAVNPTVSNSPFVFGSSAPTEGYKAPDLAILRDNQKSNSLLDRLYGLF